MTLSQETRWAYSTTARAPHGPSIHSLNMLSKNSGEKYLSAATTDGFNHNWKTNLPCFLFQHLIWLISSVVAFNHWNSSRWHNSLRCAGNNLTTTTLSHPQNYSCLEGVTLVASMYRIKFKLSLVMFTIYLTDSVHISHNDDLAQYWLRSATGANYSVPHMRTKFGDRA